MGLWGCGVWGAEALKDGGVGWCWLVDGVLSWLCVFRLCGFGWVLGWCGGFWGSFFGGLWDVGESAWCIHACSKWQTSEVPPFLKGGEGEGSGVIRAVLVASAFSYLHDVPLSDLTGVKIDPVFEHPQGCRAHHTLQGYFHMAQMVVQVEAFPNRLFAQMGANLLIL